MSHNKFNLKGFNNACKEWFKFWKKGVENTLFTKEKNRVVPEGFAGHTFVTSDLHSETVVICGPFI